MNGRNWVSIIILIFLSFIGSVLFVEINQNKNTQMLERVLTEQDRNIKELTQKTKKIESDVQTLSEKNSLLTQIEVKEPTLFTDIMDVTSLVWSTVERKPFQTQNPEGFIRVKAGTGDLSVTPPPISANTYVLAKSDWDRIGMDTVQTFYLEVHDPDTAEVLWFGPFQGPLARMVQ